MPRHPAFGFVGVALLALLLAPTLRATESAPSPTTQSGTLPNGVRYLIVPHTSPRHDLALRLIVETGSLHERDGERGFAHLVEHLAFRDTRHHPDNTLTHSLEKLGLTRGADINARTEAAHTIYKLDLPEGRDAELPTALGILRDFADGITFTAPAVASEASIVVSEVRARDQVSQQINRRFRESLYAGVRLPEPSPAQLITSISRATPEELRAFYERNYRADRLIVVAVGAADPGVLAAKIAEAFGSLVSPQGPPPAAINVLLPPSDRLPIAFQLAPTYRAAVVELVSVQPRPADDSAGRRTELLQELASRAFSHRLTTTIAPTNRGSAQLQTGLGLTPTLIERQLQVQTNMDNWPEAIGFAENELRRLRQYGFLPAELDDAVTVLRAARREAVSTFASQSSANIARQVEAALAAGHRWRSPAEILTETEAVLKGIRVEELSAVSRDMFTEPSLHLILLSGKAVEGGAEAIRTSFQNAQSARLSPPVAVSLGGTLYYDDFGPPGRVASRDHDATLDLDRVTFANGVHLNLLPTDYEPGRFQLQVLFPQNAAANPKNRGGMVELAGAVLADANTGKHVERELRQLAQLHGVNRTFDVENGLVQLTFTGPSQELGFTLRLIAAYLSDLQPDPLMFRSAVARYTGNRQNHLGEPTRRATFESLLTLSGHDARLELVPPDKFDQEDFERVQRWMGDWWLHGPVDVGLVGDISADTAVAQVAATLGALPTRVAPPAPKPLAVTRHASRRSYTVANKSGSATVSVVWPLATDDPRGNRALTLAVDVLRDRLTATLREQLGATYAPTTGVRRDPVQRDFACAWMLHTFKPDQADKLTDQALAIAARLAADGVTPEEFARLREPYRVRTAENLVDNRWWLQSVVTPAQLHPEVLAMARQPLALIDELTLAEVNQAARVFAEPAIVSIVRPKAR